MNSSAIQLKASLTTLMFVAAKPAQIFVAGEGDDLIDQSGHRYLDFVQGWAVNSLGHSSAVVQAALARQAASLVDCGPAYFNSPSALLAATLCAASGMD